MRLSFKIIPIALFVLTTVTLLSAFVLVNNKYPKDYFRSPVDRPIFLSGTFGELRSNHFHSGIDIKSLNGRSGEPIMAAAQGYISRIKIQAGGYGRAIYIAHPIGYTTVYAHLDELAPEIADYVKRKQYEFKRFEVDLYPAPTAFPVKAGQVIGKMGNSGSSFGPHLHFEIRRTAGQVPINPLHFGIDIKDNISPNIYALGVHALDENHNVMHSEYHNISLRKGGYVLDTDTIRLGAWRAAFSIKTTDRMDGAPNNNGIYALEMLVDSAESIAFKMDEVTFSKTRYLNSHIDYPAKANKKGTFHRCFIQAGNTLDFYALSGENGIVKLYKDRPRTVTLSVGDYFENYSELTFNIVRDTQMIDPQPGDCAFRVSHDKTFNYESADVRISGRSGAFYADHCIEVTSDESAGTIQYDIGDEGIPIHRYITLDLKARLIGGVPGSKHFIARLKDGEMVNTGGELIGEFLRTEIRDFGTYAVMIDTTAPEIKPLNYRPNMSGEGSMSFRIRDNFDTSGRGNGLRYACSIDGQWILFEYDAKNDLITHAFDERTPAGEHELRIEVTDDRGNSAVFRSSFTR